MRILEVQIPETDATYQIQKSRNQYRFAQISVDHTTDCEIHQTESQARQQLGQHQTNTPTEQGNY